MKLFGVLCLAFVAFVRLSAQDNVRKTEEQKVTFSEVFTQFSIVENTSVSPLKWGGGFGFSAVTNPFRSKALFIGGELSYVFTGLDKITYGGDDYLLNSSSLFALNALFQYRAFRKYNFGIYPEVCIGILAPGYSSTYYYYDNSADEQIGELQLARMFFTPNFGIGVGIRFFDRIGLKFRYQKSFSVKHFHPSDVYENQEHTEIFYPYVRKPINRFEVIGSLAF